MRKFQILIILTLTVQTIIGQEFSEKKSDSIKIVLDCKTKNIDYPILFIISLNDKTTRVIRNFKSFENDFQISPNQIKSINVLKTTKDVIDKYGKEAENGVILIELKVENKNKLTDKLKNELYKNNE